MHSRQGGVEARIIQALSQQRLAVVLEQIEDLLALHLTIKLNNTLINPIVFKRLFPILRWGKSYRLNNVSIFAPILSLLSPYGLL